MTDNRIVLHDIKLDQLGRVILPDNLILQIEDHELTLSAGGDNWNCGGTANFRCFNNACNSSVNGSCTNNTSCSGSANMAYCDGGAIEPPTNSNCA
jgi:prepilin-type processing-associated H-X9-DG protein